MFSPILLVGKPPTVFLFTASIGREAPTVCVCLRFCFFTDFIGRVRSPHHGVCFQIQARRQKIGRCFCFFPSFVSCLLLFHSSSLRGSCAPPHPGKCPAFVFLWCKVVFVLLGVLVTNNVCVGMCRICSCVSQVIERETFCWIGGEGGVVSTGLVSVNCFLH